MFAILSNLKVIVTLVVISISFISSLAHARQVTTDKLTVLTRQGDNIAQHQLGTLYFKGEHFDKDPFNLIHD
tara:strand:+ start:658 stop:873 length:216 start_codon:yes stop_codon:yes gene_type:complete